MLFEYQTPIMVTSNIALIAAIFYFLRPVLSVNGVAEDRNLHISIFLIFVICIFAVWNTDWFHYQSIFQDFKANPKAPTHIEYVYKILMQYACPNYIVFRFIVWGNALLLVYFSTKRLELNMSITCLVFGTMFILHFSYARVSLAIAMMIYGALLIYKPIEKHHTMSALAGVCFLIASLFFHKSAILGLSTAIFSMFVKVTNKNSWFFICIFFILLYLTTRFVLNDIMSIEFSYEDTAIARSQSYLGRNETQGVKAFGSLLNFYLEWLVYYIIAFACYRIQNEYIIPRHMEFIVKITFYTVIFSSIFLFDFGYNTRIIFGRMLRFTVIPATFVLSYMIQYNLMPKLTKNICIIALTRTTTYLMYSLYCTI